MKKYMYSVRDDMALIFQPPFASHNDDTAIRDFVAGCSDPKVLTANDLSLYKVGEWNDATGIFTPLEPNKIAHGSQASNVVNLQSAEAVGES